MKGLKTCFYVSCTILVLIGCIYFNALAQTPISISSVGFPLLAPDGVSTAPSFSFASTPNTGIYNSGGALFFDVLGSVPAFVNGAGINTKQFTTVSNCLSVAAPAVCGSAPSGGVIIAAAGTTVQVNTTAVTANSQILLTFDSSLGSRLSVTCNTTVPTAYSVTFRAGASNFIITATSPVTNPACFNYLIIN